jgi:uncharacterized protein
MQFDQYTVTILTLRDDAPVLDEAATAALQDGHLAHLAQLHEAGYLVAAGPLLGPPDGKYRGLSILNVDPQRALQLSQRDPAVIAGRFAVTVLPWMVPAGAMSFSPTRFPHSSAEATTSAADAEER